MTILKEKVKGLRYNVSFDVSMSDFNAEIEKKMLEYQKVADIKGFRKGHVPLTVIKQKYEDSFVGEAMNDAINSEMTAFLKEKKVNPAMQPEIKIDSFVKDKELKFSAEFDILPEIKEKDIDLTKITVEKPVAKVDAKIVEMQLKQLAESRSSNELIEKPRATKNGDIAVINFEGFVDGVAFAGGKGEKHHLELGSNSFIPGFEEQLVGKKAGEKVEVSLSFPKEYQAKDLAGKPAIFKTEIVEIREKKPVAIDDALAVSVGMKDLADLKEQIKKMTEEHYENLSKNKMKDAVLDKLAKVKIALPESLLEAEFNVMFENFEEQKKAGRLSEEDAKKSEKAVKSELTEAAEKRVKLGLLVAEIGKLAKIQVVQDDVQNAIMQEAMRFPGQHEAVFNYYNENKEAMQMLKAQLFETKILDYMVGQVVAKEKIVKVEELTGEK